MIWFSVVEENSRYSQNQTKPKQNTKKQGFKFPFYNMPVIYLFSIYPYLILPCFFNQVYTCGWKYVQIPLDFYACSVLLFLRGKKKGFGNT